MQYTNLGRTGLKVSRLCLGTMNFGPRTSEADSFAIMDRALDEGVNFFDTANRYGSPVEVGFTESILGRWLAQGGRREKVVLASKVYGPMGDWPNQRGLSAYHIRQACEDSLRRLQTDHLDLYQMHHIDRDTPFEEIWQAMELLVQQGKVIYVGSSNFPGWCLARAQETAAARGFLGLVSEQSLYNLAARTVELEVIPAIRAYGLGLLPWSPLAGGLLAGAPAGGDDKSRRAATAAQDRREQQSEALDAYHALCAKLDAEPQAVALAWLLSRPQVTAPIIGPRTMAQFEGALLALELSLDDETLAELDRIWPGPGGEAPEAYAW